eukprot:TRINITY_DN7235_c0_g1_i1.p1 TRINITY_DN7235_c0_g1~~TRINITY_DN7235_c0_g1_i1.p1  ORF type:complete len:645 (-),score=151.72 TRINITY_DN7235_c0_g1_i1:11-1855(-)
MAVLLGAEALQGKRNKLSPPSYSLPEDASLNKYSLEFSYEELRRATCDFDRSLKLGSGGFGVVYKGTQSDGTEIAVKAMEVPKESGFEEEVRVLSMFRHPNLVTLMGFARNGSNRFLVYELLEGGDVFHRLQRSGSRVQDFSWRERVCAVYDAACGLSHLHHQDPKVFHRDIKSPNILLTRAGTAKMADFGLACLSRHKVHKVGQFAGTVGYICPIYAKTNAITERSEVYSFGIVLLEVLTASPAAWKSPGAEEAYNFLVHTVDDDLSRLAQLLDPLANWPLQVAMDIGYLALRCISCPHEESRPDFTEVVHLLRPLRDAPEDACCAVPVPRVLPVQQRVPSLVQVVKQQVAQVAQQQVQVVHQQVVQQQQLAGYISYTPAPPAPPPAQAAAPGPLLWCLSVVWVQNRDIRRELPMQDLNFECRSPPDTSSISVAPMVFGRTDFEAWLLKLVPPELLSCVSRKHFEISAEVKPEAIIEPGDTRLPCAFKIHNHSRNVIGIGGADSKIVESQQDMVLQEALLPGSRFSSSSSCSATQRIQEASERYETSTEGLKTVSRCKKVKTPPCRRKACPAAAAGNSSTPRLSLIHHGGCQRWRLSGQSKASCAFRSRRFLP